MGREPGSRADAVPPRLAISLSPAGFDDSGSAASRLSALVRAAAAHGVLLFDLTEAPEPQRWWDLAAVAAGPHWREATVFVGAAGTSGAIRKEEPFPRNVVRFYEEPGSPREARDPVRPAGGARFRDLALAEVEAERSLKAGATWVSVPGHLLEARRVRALVETVREVGGDVLLTNPHADGRLDGRWLSEGTLSTGGTPHPLGFAELQRAYAPLLPLGFLTEGHRRTLAQAAVAFVQAVGAVPSVRVRDLRQLDELADAGRFPPLSAEEMARIDASVAGSLDLSGPAPAPGFK
jgi:hypothetical protein